MSAVTILDVQVDRIAYKGEPVTTFAQVDRVHQRPDGTAGRTFRENRGRFNEDEDFITVDQPDAIRRLGLARPQGGTPEKIILLRERGYLKLTKPMSDDRAWAVQGEMVDRYFAADKPKVALTSPGRDARDVNNTFKSFVSIGRMIGLDRNQAAISANQATIETTGVDTLALLGATHLVAPQQALLLTPTEIGAKLGGKGARYINLLLQRLGYQTGPNWTPTDKGVPYGVFLDTGKKQKSGTPIRQLKWSADIVPILQAAIRPPNAPS